jgi:hypothetical protein
MAFNGSGTFNRLYNWVNDRDNNVKILASKMDQEMDGFATGLSNCITRNGESAIISNISLNNYKLTGLANGSSRTDSINLGQVQDGTYTYLGLTNGSADAYTLVPSTTITSYLSSHRFAVKIHATNATTTPYLQISAIVNPTTTAVIKKLSATKAEIAVEASDLLADGIYEFQRNSANDAWIVLNPEKTFYNLTNGTKASSTVQGILALTPNKTIYLSNNTTDATNDIDATAGWFNFDDGSGQAYYAGGTGQLDIIFGTNNGMLDTGTIANTTYHIFLIYNPTTVVSKLLASTSVSSPTLPSGYTKKVRIGSIIRLVAAILPFSQCEKYFFHKLVREDRTTVAAPTTVGNLNLTIPIGLSVLSVIIGYLIEGSTSGGSVLIVDPSYSDFNITAANFTLKIATPGGSQQANTTGMLFIKTNNSGQVSIKSSTTSVNLGILTNGWIDYQLNY